MKKERVYTFLTVLERKTRAKTDLDASALQSALQAIDQCRTWVQLQWTHMLEPVEKARDVLRDEWNPLVEKYKLQQCTDPEKVRLAQIAAIDAMYTAFLKKIRPTVQNTQRAQEARLRERRLTPTELPPVKER